MSGSVTYEVDGDVAVVTLRRPDKLNALSPQMVDDLQKIWQRFADGGERAAVLPRKPVRTDWRTSRSARRWHWQKP